MWVLSIGLVSSVHRIVGQRIQFELAEGQPAMLALTSHKPVYRYLSGLPGTPALCAIVRTHLSMFRHCDPPPARPLADGHTDAGRVHAGRGKLLFPPLCSRSRNPNYDPDDLT